MRDVAIKKICKTLTETYNIILDDKIALDFFARGADWQTQYYAQKVKKVYAWEIENRFEEKLKENLPLNAEITMGNSFVLAQNKNDFFDMVVLDNPQGCYGLDNVYCEHFEALDVSLSMLKKAGGILILNVKTKPFNYDDKLQWQSRRNNFYSLEDCSSLSKEFVLEFYKEYLSQRGYKTNFAFLVRRPQESGLQALTMQITRKCDDN